MRISMSLVYPVFALMTILASVFLIPRNQYKKYFLYSFLIGGILYPISFFVSSIWLNAFKYQNFGIFNIGGYVSLWTPMTFIFMFTIFLYLMPVRRIFLVLYLIMWAGVNAVVGTVFQSLGLIVFPIRNGQWIDLAFIMFWHLIVAWIYIRAEKIEILSSPEEKRQVYLEKSKISRYVMSPVPAKKQDMKLKKKRIKPKKI